MGQWEQSGTAPGLLPTEVRWHQHKKNAERKCRPLTFIHMRPKYLRRNHTHGKDLLSLKPLCAQPSPPPARAATPHTWLLLCLYTELSLLNGFLYGETRNAVCSLLAQLSCNGASRASCCPADTPPVECHCVSGTQSTAAPEQSTNSPPICYRTKLRALWFSILILRQVFLRWKPAYRTVLLGPHNSCS